MKLKPILELSETTNPPSQPPRLAGHNLSNNEQPAQPTCGQRLITMAEVLRITGVSRGTIYNMRRAGEFVHPVKVGPRMVRYVESEVHAWIEERVAMRDGKEVRRA